MVRRLSAEERALWQRVVETVTPIAGAAPLPAADPEAAPFPPARPAKAKAASPVAPAPAPRAKKRPVGPGTTLDASWDRRLARGLVSPDFVLDLHGHRLASAYDMLDQRLDQAIALGARLLLLITGKPPSDDRRPARRGAIRAAVGDWLAASRHGPMIAAVRGAHPRHGGSGALYIVIRRRRDPAEPAG